MKKILLFILLLLTTSAYSQKVKVSMKSGTVLVGNIKSIDPQKSVHLIISGADVEIMMSDVNIIEPVDTVMKKAVVKKWKTDTNFPDSVQVRIGDNIVTMLLVKGGEFSMGYDGSGSWAMKSEPIHQVRLTSYYISSEYVNKSVYDYVIDKKETKHRNVAVEKQWKGVVAFFDNLDKMTGLPYRLPTEAEWEYAACDQDMHGIFNEKRKYDWCSDFFKTYDSEGIQVDPTGPEKGKHRIKRTFDALGKDDKYHRVVRDPENFIPQYSFHIVIKAKDLIKH